MCWHKWSKWETVARGRLVDCGIVCGKYAQQEKYCEKCGKVKIRTEED